MKTIETTNPQKLAKLQSYSQGKWFTSPETGAILKNAVTGDDVASICSDGLDFAAMANYARTVGGPALREFTFHQRAMMVKNLATYLLERKELFYELSTATGATRADSWIDIEGGIGTLFSISSKARIEMPNSKVFPEGKQEQLSRKGTFVGQHIYTPLQGVAIHINAYNFPCWGMLEKLAPALVAGMPVIVKPASQTAYLTELMVRHIVESNILPEGSLQLICGRTGDLLDHVTYQDVVSFTGSASTGLRLRQGEKIAAANTRFIMEADSLNCTILGDDVEPGSAEFDLFVNEVVREMTVKAGQKCTAIRRAIVPTTKLDAVSDAISKALEQVVVGDPADDSVTMGALAGTDQRQDVLTAVDQLLKHSRLAFGDVTQQSFVGENTSNGAFLSPLLMVANDPHTTVAHDVEAFGPVCTLVGYTDREDAVRLAAKGKGSLVGSLVTNDGDVAQDITLGVAAHHGRILILNEACAKESTGHGSPLPQLVHGGPGRAGGGEELGGVRGIKHYMQRTALQGSPDMLSNVTGIHMTGSTVKSSEIHPFQKTFEELEVGDTLITEKRTVTLEDIEAFAELSGDKFYAHTNEEAAARNPFFDGRVAHGYLLVSIAAGLFVWPDEGPVLANTGLENLQFQKPVYPGDVVHVQFTCKQKKNRETETWGEVRWDTTIFNQNGDICAHYDVLTGVANSSDETK